MILLKQMIEKKNNENANRKEKNTETERERENDENERKKCRIREKKIKIIYKSLALSVAFYNICPRTAFAQHRIDL